ncbi:uncharacterized protein LOC135389626 [Ornithodoros turicata]|uniref:uncharacterized protein LOC135389626 n=1 Tax=Ornithodoros turicata TaxID=34597 RepID=UPI0031395CB6
MWTKHDFGESTAFSDTSLASTRNELVTMKLLLVDHPDMQDGSVAYELYFKGSLFRKDRLHSTDELVETLQHAASLDLCSGCGKTEDFMPLLIEHIPSVRVRNGDVISRKCTLVTNIKGTACLQCKYTRKLLLTRKCKSQKQHSKKIPSTLRALKKQVKRRDTKIHSLQSKVREMHQRTAQIETEVLEEKIKSLKSQKQQLRSGLALRLQSALQPEACTTNKNGCWSASSYV